MFVDPIYPLNIFISALLLIREYIFLWSSTSDIPLMTYEISSISCGICIHLYQSFASISNSSCTSYIWLPINLDSSLLIVVGDTIIESSYTLYRRICIWSSFSAMFPSQSTMISSFRAYTSECGFHCPSGVNKNNSSRSFMTFTVGFEVRK